MCELKQGHCIGETAFAQGILSLFSLPGFSFANEAFLCYNGEKYEISTNSQFGGFDYDDSRDGTGEPDSCSPG